MVPRKTEKSIAHGVDSEHFEKGGGEALRIF